MARLSEINSDEVYASYVLADVEVPIWVRLERDEIFLRNRMRRVIQHMQRVCAAERKEALSLFLLRVYMRALGADARNHKRVMSSGRRSHETSKSNKRQSPVAQLETIHKEEELWRKFQ